MVTKVKIKNGKLVDLESEYVYTNEIPEREYFVANRWIGQRRKNGRISFSSTDKNGLSRIWCNIETDGTLIAYRKRSNSRPLKMFTSKLADDISSVSGTMILGGGNTLDRTIKFYKEYKENIPKYHGITKVKREDSNRLFPVNLGGSDKYKSFAVVTDGKKQYISFNDVLYVSITDSTYAVICEYNRTESNVTLYTKHNLHSLDSKLPYIDLDKGMFYIDQEGDFVVYEKRTMVQQA